MDYEITVWKLAGKEDRIVDVFVTTTSTRRDAGELFDRVVRELQGHYKAQLRDTTGQIVRESNFTWKDKKQQ